MKAIKSIALSAITALGLDLSSIPKKRNKVSHFSGSHEEDLMIRLQNVANKAKPEGKRKQIGEHHSYAMHRKEHKAKLRYQFRGAVDEITGLSSHYLKNGELVARV